ncbi:hypothetical protein [Roseibium aggregatum]|uniref:Uncharacterized protein n=1 Tax=Roseibium aggregatum TaxID=187304 RepID=A0A939J6P0_9HYPH|nr:hypothetical protein [Roseibium aggregatum]
MVADHFEASGFAIDRRVPLDLDGDPDINRLSAEPLFQEGKRVIHKDSDALFNSSAGLRIVQVVERLGQEIGKPVVTGNQARAWECPRLLNLLDLNLLLTPGCYRKQTLGVGYTRRQPVATGQTMRFVRGVRKSRCGHCGSCSPKVRHRLRSRRSRRRIGRSHCL